MTCVARSRSLALLALAGLGLGCNETTTTSVNQTPPPVLAPTAPDESPAAPAPKDPAASPAAADNSATAAAPAQAVTPIDLAAAPTPQPAAPAAGEVTLTPVKYDELLARIAANKSAKFTLVDIWATWCPPCMENFPHVVQMNAKYADQGLAVASLSFDDATDPAALKKAKEFLEGKKAVFPNYVLDEPNDVAFEKFDLVAIPAVYLFGPDGKEMKRYTWDDPNNQFTYEQVERDVAAMLQGKPAPGAAAAKPDAPKPGAPKANDDPPKD